MMKKKGVSFRLTYSLHVSRAGRERKRQAREKEFVLRRWREEVDALLAQID